MSSHGEFQHCSLCVNVLHTSPRTHILSVRGLVEETNFALLKRFTWKVKNHPKVDGDSKDGNFGVVSSVVYPCLSKQQAIRCARHNMWLERQMQVRRSMAHERRY
jgi:hypothetical protein